MEPPTTAKVVFQTTEGEIEIALWAKEIPLTSRNFLQMCKNGYYDGSSFDRVVPGIIVEIGDSAGTASKEESTHSGVTLKNEFNQRLKFSRRGMIGMSHVSGSNISESRFFITLGPTPEYNGKNTVFGHVIGDSIFIVNNIADRALEDDGRPIFPVKISKTEVIEPYFTDLKEPESRKQKVAIDFEKKEKNSKKIPKKKKASINYDEEEESEGSVPVRKLRPAHDLLDDKILKKRHIEEKEPKIATEAISETSNLSAESSHIKQSTSTNDTIISIDKSSKKSSSSVSESKASREKFTFSKIQEFTQKLSSREPSWLNDVSDEDEHYSDNDFILNQENQ